MYLLCSGQNREYHTLRCKFAPSSRFDMANRPGILAPQHIMYADIAQEGALIASEVMEATGPLQKLCAKCSKLLFPSDKPAGQVKMCHGNCHAQNSFPFYMHRCTISDND